MPKAIITVDLGFGDSGKGATVDWLCRQHSADLVVRYSGGAQCGHNVVLPDGRQHAFAQFGAGTFAGVRTFLGPDVIIKPKGIYAEAGVLADLGVDNPMSMLTVHPGCIVATAYHQAMNRIREDSRNIRHGSCGLGIGEARRYWLDHGMDSVFASDLHDPETMRKKLSILRQRLALEIQKGGFKVTAENDFRRIDPGFVADGLHDHSHRLRVDDMPLCETTIYEAAQGVLLDETFGFHPHTTWSTVTASNAMEMLPYSGADVTVLGVTRAYMSRHGDGPLPTYSSKLTRHALDKGNPPNQWQGSMRLGWLDISLLSYAVKNCGAKLDGIVVNHLDQLPEESFFAPRYKLLPLPDKGDATLARQEELGQFLESAVPHLQRADSDDILAAIDDLAPIYATSNGETHEHRTMDAGVLA
jgi:adenylosuccinate synthase